MSESQHGNANNFEVFKSLKDDDSISIFGFKKTRTLKKGEILFREGEPINGVYVIKDGVCKLSKLSANGNDQIVKLVVRGNLIGHRSLITKELANLTAVAVNNVEVYFLPKEQVLHDLKKNVNFTIDMLQDMAMKLKYADNVIVDMAQKSVTQRLADILRFLYKHFDTDADGYLGVILSREDYASIVGTATESAIRILSSFKKEGLISTSGKRIKVEDFSKLKRVS